MRGVEGVDKQIFLGIRQADADIDYLSAFLKLARSSGNIQSVKAQDSAPIRLRGTHHQGLRTHDPILVEGKRCFPMENTYNQKRESIVLHGHPQSRSMAN